MMSRRKSTTLASPEAIVNIDQMVNDQGRASSALQESFFLPQIAIWQVWTGEPTFWFRDWQISAQERQNFFRVRPKSALDRHRWLF